MAQLLVIGYKLPVCNDDPPPPPPASLPKNLTSIFEFNGGADANVSVDPVTV